MTNDIDELIKRLPADLRENGQALVDAVSRLKAENKYLRDLNGRLQEKVDIFARLTDSIDAAMDEFAAALDGAEK